MKAAALAAATGAAGVLGGVIGAFLAGGGASSPAAAPPAAPVAAEPAAGDLAKEVASLRARLEEMQASVVHASAETTRLKDEVAAERKEAAEREKVAAATAAGIHRLRGLRAPRGKDGSAPQLLEEGDTPVFAMAAVDGAGLPERFRKAMELRRKTEDERWAAAREALGLTATQEEELKAALKERNEAMNGAMKITSTENVAPDGTKSNAVTIAMPDAGKLEEARKRYDDRVAGALNQDQARKWKDDGYEQAMGGGLGLGGHAAIMDVHVEDVPPAK
jgi:hypothetical protein